MADTKTTKSSQRPLDSATRRENLVKQANAEQKARAKLRQNLYKPTPEAEQAQPTTNVVRNQSLEEQYLAKFQEQQKKAMAKQPATPKAPPKTPVKVVAKTRVPTTPKPIAVAKPAPQPQPKQANVMQASDKEKQKSLVIVMLSIAIVLVLLLSSIFIFTNLGTRKLGTLKVEGSGVSWFVDGKDQTKFGIKSGSELVADCQFTIDIKLKKTTNDSINLRITYKGYVGNTIIPKSQFGLTGLNTNFVYNENLGYVYEGWSEQSGSYLQVCSGFTINNVANITNDNFKVEMTVYVY